jgi:hypothetical protein
VLVGAIGAGMAAAALVARLQARRQPGLAGAGASAVDDDKADALGSAGADPLPSPAEPPSGEGAPAEGLAGWSAAVSEAVPAPPPPPPPSDDRVSFAEIPPATRPPERTEAAADSDRPPLPSRTPQAQAPIPAEEPMPYEPPVFDVADIAPLADLARASWGSQAVVDDPAPPPPPAPAPPPAHAGSVTTEAPAAPPAPAEGPGRALTGPLGRPAGQGAAPPPPVSTPAGPGANGTSAVTTGSSSPAPAAASPTGAEPGGPAVGSPGGPDGRRRWLIAGGAVAAVAAVAVGVGVLAGGGDDDPVATTATTDRPSSATTGTTGTTAPPSPEQAFRQAGTKLSEAGSFTYAGSARALDVTPVRPTRWLGTELTVTGEVDLGTGRLHEVAVAPDGEATETVIDGATVWGRQADSVDELADAEYSVIDELTRDTPTPQGAQLVPVWLALAAGPVPAPEAAAQPAYSGTLTAAALGDDSGATPDSVITVTLDAGGTPIHLEVVGLPDGEGLRLVYDLANVGQVGPITSPGDAEEPADDSTDTTGAPVTSSTSVGDTTPPDSASTTTSTTERRRGGPGSGPGSTEPPPD